jgi:hypothetical protein
VFLIRSVALKEKERGHQVILMSSRRIGVGLFCVSIVCFCSVVVLSRARDVQLDLESGRARDPEGKSKREKE